MNLTNYHSHSLYCDGHASLEEFIQKAIELGFTSYGVSSHAPLPFSTSWNMDSTKLAGYIQECKFIQDKYAHEIEFYLGLEIDYLDEAYHPAIDFFTSLELDYSIGSVHLLKIDSGHYVDIDTGAELFRENVMKYFHRDYEEVVIRYFDAMKQLILKGGFDFLGHCDKISKNASVCAKGICESSFYTTIVKDYFEFIAQHQCMVEVNTKAYDQTGMFFPNIEHFAYLRELDIPVVVNSDSHRLEKINSGRKEALKALVDAKFDHVMELKQKEWTAVPIHSSYRI